MANFGDVVQEYYVNKFRKNAAVRQKKLRSLDCKAAAEAYVEEVKKRIRGSFDLPTEKTPLNARIVGTVQREGYRALGDFQLGDVAAVINEKRLWRSG